MCGMFTLCWVLRGTCVEIPSQIWVRPGLHLQGARSAMGRQEHSQLQVEFKGWNRYLRSTVDGAVNPDWGNLGRALGGFELVCKDDQNFWHLEKSVVRINVSVISYSGQTLLHSLFEIDCKIFRSTEEALEMVKKSLILVGVLGSERFCHVIIEHSQLCNPKRS